VYKEKVLVIHIQELVKKHNISLRELSRRADIDIARLSELSSENGNESILGTSNE
jgi:hypothetical protein